MKVSDETKKTINLIQSFLTELQEKEVKENQDREEVYYSGHLGNMLFKINKVKEELEIDDES